MGSFRLSSRIFLWDDEKVLGRDRGDGYTTS